MSDGASTVSALSLTPSGPRDHGDLAPPASRQYSSIGSMGSMSVLPRLAVGMDHTTSYGNARNARTTHVISDVASNAAGLVSAPVAPIEPTHDSVSESASGHGAATNTDSDVNSDSVSGTDTNSDSDSALSTTSTRTQSTVWYDDDVTAQELYSAKDSLVRAVNDAKVLYIAFRALPCPNSKAYPGRFEFLLAPGDRCSESACPLQLHISTAKTAPDFYGDLTATPDGTWLMKGLGAVGLTQSFESLHAVLSASRGRGLINATAVAMPYVKFYLWVQPQEAPEEVLTDRTARRARRAAWNSAYRDKYFVDVADDDALLRGDKPFQILESPYRQPHVVLLTLRARVQTKPKTSLSSSSSSSFSSFGRSDVTSSYEIADYVLGYHEASETWFLTPPLLHVAYLSLSLQALVTQSVQLVLRDAVPAKTKADGTARKRRSDVGKTHKSRRLGPDGRALPLSRSLTSEM